MNTLRQLSAKPPTIPTRTTWYLTDLAEARSRQELFIRQTEMLEHALASKEGDFTVAELEKLCPGVSLELICYRLNELNFDGSVECVGRDPGAKWRKRGNKSGGMD